MRDEERYKVTVQKALQDPLLGVVDSALVGTMLMLDATALLAESGFGEERFLRLASMTYRNSVERVANYHLKIARTGAVAALAGRTP